MTQKDPACLSKVYFARRKNNKQWDWTIWASGIENVTWGQFQDTWSNKCNSTCAGNDTEYSDPSQNLINKTQYHVSKV